jgi:hypothetical protein
MSAVTSPRTRSLLAGYGVILDGSSGDDCPPASRLGDGYYNALAGPAPPAAPAAQSAPAASTATSGHRGLNGIGRGSKSGIDDNYGTFTIVSVKYNTAQATAAFPDLLTRCKCVVGSHGRQRERLCPHWDALMQTGDATHNVVNTSVHEPIAGLTGVKGALDFAKQ